MDDSVSTGLCVLSVLSRGRDRAVVVARRRRRSQRRTEDDDAEDDDI